MKRYEELFKKVVSKIDEAKEGQGFNDARGEVPDTQDIPKHNGQNVNNDPAHLRDKKQEKEKQKQPQ